MSVTPTTAQKEIKRAGSQLTGSCTSKQGQHKYMNKGPKSKLTTEAIAASHATHLEHAFLSTSRPPLLRRA